MSREPITRYQARALVVHATVQTLRHDLASILSWEDLPQLTESEMEVVIESAVNCADVLEILIRLGFPDIDVLWEGLL